MITCLLGIFAVSDCRSEENTTSDAAALNEIVVTSKRSGESLQVHAGNIAKLSGDSLRRLAAQHTSEVFAKIPGGWVVKGSGQEHQTAIRSPVLTGGGACAVFLVLENGIPVRPPGFCNVNILSETLYELADTIEVIRGPGNALYGSNSLHGTVNLLMPRPGSSPYAAVEAGSSDYRRIRGRLTFGDSDSWIASGAYSADGGYREDSGYDQAKFYLAHETNWKGGDLSLSLSAMDLSQDSAGFIYGEDAYKDDAINHSNSSLDAYRHMESQRLMATWVKAVDTFDVDVRTYLRHSSMGFRHHETPGTPGEKNGHESAGLLLALHRERGAVSTSLGLDIDVSSVELLQSQDEPASGSPRVVETRPVGRHYDYEVNSLTLAPYIQAKRQLSERWSLGAGLRLEYSGYDYDNRMVPGNTREDGSACGFGGCLYSRPADRRDHFRNLAPKLAVSYRWSNDTTLFLNTARGFRAPQIIELYRLQNGQEVSDLKTERLDSVEAGMRTSRGNALLELTGYAMRKRDSVFRDSQGFTASGGRSRHSGAEFAVAYTVGDAWNLNGNIAYGRHKYDFSLDAQQGESYIAGLDIDTAPRLLGSMEIAYRPSQGSYEAALQFATVGSYYLDSLNAYEYRGHTLANLRVGLRLGEALMLTARLKNLADRNFADRADFGGGDYRYLPGRGREASLEIGWVPSTH